MKSQTDKSLSHKAFLFFVFTIRVELIKDFIDFKFIISPYRLGIGKILHKLCIWGFFSWYNDSKGGMSCMLWRSYCSASSPCRALQHCEELIQRYNRAEDSICLPDNKPLPHQNVTNHVGKAVEDCMRAIIGVLLNLTNDNGKTNQKILHILC